MAQHVCAWEVLEWTYKLCIDTHRENDFFCLWDECSASVSPELRLVNPLHEALHAMNYNSWGQRPGPLLSLMIFLRDDPKTLCNGWSIILTAFLESRDYCFIVNVETESQKYCDLYMITVEGIQKRKKGVTSDINSSSFPPSYSLHGLRNFLYSNKPHKCFKALFVYGQQMKIPGWKG